MAEQKAVAGRRYKGILVMFLVFGPAFLLIFISTRGCEHKFKELDDMGEIPAFEFRDLNGKKYTNASFRNQAVIYTTIQKTCPDSCAIQLFSVDKLIYQNLFKNKKRLGYVRIVSFVTDGKGNPSHDLADVAFVLKDQVPNYDPKLWIIADGDARKVFDIKRNGVKLAERGDKFYGGEAFQEMLLLADKQNHLRMVLWGNREGMVRRMYEHIALLDKQYDKAAYDLKHKK